MVSIMRRSFNVALSPSRQAVIKSFQRSQGSESGGNHLLDKKTPGLSNKVVSVPETEVGPGASKNSTYKNPEYFCYDQSSFFEAEVELLKYRLPQPSNKQ